MQPSDKLIDRGTLAFRLELDAAVEEVAHPPNHTQRFRRYSRSGSERNALNPAAYPCVCALAVHPPSMVPQVRLELSKSRFPGLQQFGSTLGTVK